MLFGGCISYGIFPFVIFKVKLKKQKGISMIVTYKRKIPVNADMNDVQEQIDEIGSMKKIEPFIVEKYSVKWNSY